MIRQTLTGVLLVGVAQFGCGDNLSQKTCQSGETVNLIIRGIQHSAVRSRVDNSDWFDIAPSQNRLDELVYYVCADESYSFHFGCGDPLGTRTILQFDATTQEKTLITQDCGRAGDQGNGPSLQGKMKQAGWVRVGDTEQERPWDNWSFSFAVKRAGVYDIVAGTDDALVIRHGVEIVADTLVPDIDVDVEGRALKSRTIMVSDVRPEAQIVKRSTLRTVHGTRASMPDAIDNHIFVPDPDQLTQGDRVLIDVSAYERLPPVTYWRNNTQLLADAGGIDIELMQRLSLDLVPTGSPPGVESSLVPLNGWTNADIVYQSNEVEKYRSFTSGWFALHREDEPWLVIPSELGPEWDQAIEYEPSLTLIDSSPTVSRSSSIAPSRPF